MDQSKTPAASSSDTSQQQSIDSMESPIYHAHPQGALTFASWENQQHQYGPEAQANSEFTGYFDSVQWLGDAPVAAYGSGLYDNTNNSSSSNDVVWPPMQEQVPMGGDHHSYSNPSPIAESPASLAGYQGQWTPSPGGYPPATTAAPPWMPSKGQDQLQPLPSPLSEVPSYGSEMQIPAYGGYAFTQNPAQDGAAAVPTTGFLSDSQQEYASPPPHALSSVASGPSKPKSTKRGRPKGSTNKKVGDGAQSTKGTKRKTPPPTGADSPGAASSTSSVNLGIFPPNVDPREASQKLQREAWERCKTEAASMSRRRELLLSSRTELQKETHKLQINIGQLREAVAREHEQLKEAVRIAARLNEEGLY